MHIDSLMISLIVILFPILVNILHDLYINNIDKKENDLFFDISLISSLYLFAVLDVSISGFMVVVNTVFLLALIKKRIFTSFLMFLFILFSYEMNGIHTELVTTFQFMIIYLFYFIFYLRKKENLFINLFMIIKIIFISIFYINSNYSDVFFHSIYTSIVFIFYSYLVVYIVSISEDIVTLHLNLKEFEQQKQIKDSLFKITHEIKNPIAVCKSYLDMFDFNNPDHERYIHILKEEMNNILILLQDFKNMSNIEIKNEILDINMLLEEIVRQLSPMLKRENIDFIVDINDDEFYIEGDYNRLRQVLTNFIKNSKEAKDANKKSFIRLKTKIKNNNFIIIVEDNGIGMSKEAIKRIEEPFYTTKKNGTGLGVPLSSEIIKSHNGDIKFESKEGVGTKVIITLPFSEIEF